MHEKTISYFAVLKYRVSSLHQMYETIVSFGVYCSLQNIRLTLH